MILYLCTWLSTGRNIGLWLVPGLFGVAGFASGWNDATSAPALVGLLRGAGVFVVWHLLIRGYRHFRGLP